MTDTLYTQGNFFISSLINFYARDGEDGLVLIGFLNNYAHYQSVSKKLGFNMELSINSGDMTYIDGFNKVIDWIPEDIPFTETTTPAWIPLPKKAIPFTVREGKNRESLQDLVQIIDKALVSKKGYYSRFTIEHMCVYVLITKDLKFYIQFFKKKNPVFFKEEKPS